MSVLRSVGGAWLGVHAPSAPRAMWMWLLERGFRGVLAAPGPRVVDWRAMAEARQNLPASFVGVSLGGVLRPMKDRPEAGLASANDNDRVAAFAAVRGAVELATALGVTTVLIEPGVVRVPGEPGPTDLSDVTVGWTPEKAAAWLLRRNAVLDRSLDAACRFFHRVCKTFPEAQFCLTGSADLLGMGEPVALAAIFADLRGLRLGYWHDAPVAARRQQLLGVPQGEWLHLFADRLVGATVSDTCEGSLYALPGSGAVDYPLLAAYKPRRARPLSAVLELEAGVEPAELPGAMAFLDKFGL